MFDQPIEKQEETTALSKTQHGIFLFSIFCFWFSTYIYIPTFGVYLEDTGLNYSAIGIILGAYGISQVLLRLPLGVFLEWLDSSKKKWLIFGFIMAIVSGILLVYSESFSLILIARLLAGVTASMWVMATIMYGQYFPVYKSTKAMSTMQFITVFTQFISMVLCSVLIQWYGWTFPFWIATLTAVLGAALLLFVPEVRRPTSRNTSSYWNICKKTFKVKNLMNISILSIIGHAILFITIFGFSPIYVVNLGYGEQAITWIVYAFFIPHALASLGLAFYSLDPAYNRAALIISFAFSSLCLAVLSGTDSIALVLLSHVGVGLALGFVLPILLGEAASLGSSDMKLPTMGFYQSLYAIGIFLGPIVAGEIAARADLEAVFYFATSLSVIAILVLILGNYASSSKAN
ncbi:MFS transporter [Halobacillus seohaensis]|uniref:MFS transporter n=1 Tax=Halobacillus seohaensis TaxID=447421 RepID=A0ABW2ENK5_9BACI